MDILDQIHADELRYFFIPEYDKVICCVQRAGSTSMDMSLRSISTRISQSEVLKKRREGVKILMWVRDPLDRLMCMYSLFDCEMSPGAFVSETTGNYNYHWSPQTKMHLAHNIFLPTHVYAFDKLAETWEIEFPNHPLKWLNKSKKSINFHNFKKNLSACELTLVMMHWGDDRKLHRKAMSDGVVKENNQ